MAATSGKTSPSTAGRVTRPHSSDAFIPSSKPRKSAKAQDSGLLEEERGLRILSGTRNPGVRFPRCSNARTGTGDISQFHAFLKKVGVPTCTPEVADRPDYNTLIEYKSQKRSGSVDMKIISAIQDLASAADTKGFVPALVISSPGGVFTDAQLAQYILEGERHAVLVITIEDAANPLRFHRGLGRIARQRQEIAKLIGARGGLSRLLRHPNPQMRAYVGRVDARANLLNALTNA